MKWVEFIQRFMEPKVKGIIHVGANDCEEYDEYKAAGVGRMLLIEPQKSAFERLKNRVGSDPGVSLMQVACGAAHETGILNIAKGPGDHHDYSSSFLDLHRHAALHPDISFVGKEPTQIIPLDGSFGTLGLPPGSFNLLVCDVQGYEVHVFAGAPKTLALVDYVLCEVNQDEVYAKCPLVGEIDFILGKHGLRRVMTDWCGPGKTYGDALYISRA